jgi:cell wall-associated NlpC family hydrolase
MRVEHYIMTFSLPSRPHVSRIVSCCALVVLASASAEAQRADNVKEMPKPFAAFSASAHSIRDSIVAVARAQIGTKYVRGGTSPEGGFDCSGLVRYVMAALEVRMPRTAKQQATKGLAVDRDTNRLRPGDLLTFGKGKRGVSHIGIYVGNGRYIHASSGTGRVVESDITRSGSPLVRAWRGVRRIVLGADSTARKGDG